MSGVTDEMRDAVSAYVARCVRTADGCLVNPRLTGDHYGEVRFADRRMAAHRAVAAVREGYVPPLDVVARHSCDNRRCVEPTHIQFGTQSQNINDIYERGRRRSSAWPRGEARPQALLTEQIVCEMRQMARQGASLGQIVSHFGFPYSPTRMAVRGESWAHVTSEPPVPGRKNRKPNPHAYRFTRIEEARAALELKSQGLSLAEVGQRLGVSRSTAWKLTQVASP